MKKFPWMATIVKYAEKNETYRTVTPLYEESLRAIREDLLKKGVYVEIKHRLGKIEKGEILLEVTVHAKTPSRLSWAIDRVLKEIDDYLLIWGES